MQITTQRLALIAATAELLSAEMEDLAAFRQKLRVEVPASWPPDFYDRPAQEWMLNYLKENTDAAGWGLWYLVLRGTNEFPETLIGTCGYKGIPSADGTVEIGYSVLPEYQRKGYATEAAKALVGRAFEHSELSRVIAETYPELTASIRVLEKNGFVLTGNGSEPGVIRFELSRNAYGMKIQENKKKNPL